MLLHLRSSQDVFDVLGFEHIRPEFRNVGGEYKRILGLEDVVESEEEYTEEQQFWFDESEDEDGGTTR